MAGEIYVSQLLLISPGHLQFPIACFPPSRVAPCVEMFGCPQRAEPWPPLIPPR